MTALRELSVRYGSVTAGGISDAYLLDGFTRHSVTDGKAESFVEFDITVVATSTAALAQRCAAIEREFRTPRKSLVVTQSGIALLNVSHSTTAGGFNTEPEIRKVGQIGDSGRSRRYTVRVRYETPADTATTSGLRESTVNVSYDASRIRTIGIAGTFTATSGSQTARAKYEAAIAAHASSILSALSVTASELVDEPTSAHDYDNKVIRFERTYRELIFGQGTDSPSNDTGIVAQSLTVSRRHFSEERSAVSGEGGDAQMLATFDVRYEASIDATVTTNLKAKYDTIRTWLVGQIRAVFSQGQFALTVEAPSFDRPNNRIMVDLTAEGPVDGNSLVRRTLTVDDRIQEPIEIVPAWDGDVLGAYIYTGHAIVTRFITESYRIIGSVSGAAANARGLELSGMYAYPPAKYAQGTWHLIESGGNATPVRIGIAGKETLDMADVTATVTMRRAKRIAGETQTSERGPSARGPTTPNSGPNVTVANSNFGAGLAGSA